MAERLPKLWRKQRAAYLDGIGTLFADEEFSDTFDRAVTLYLRGIRMRSDTPDAVVERLLAEAKGVARGIT